MCQCSLDLGNQRLRLLDSPILTLSIETIRLHHRVQLCRPRQDCRDRGHEAQNVGEISKDGERGDVLFVGREGQVGGEVEGGAVEEVEYVG